LQLLLALPLVALIVIVAAYYSDARTATGVMLLGTAVYAFTWAIAAIMTQGWRVTMLGSILLQVRGQA
jgi:hypothetical protein